MHEKVNYTKRYAKGDVLKNSLNIAAFFAFTLLTVTEVLGMSDFLSMFIKGSVLFTALLGFAYLFSLYMLLQSIFPSISFTYVAIRKQMNMPLKDAVELINDSFDSEEVLFEGKTAILNRHYLLYRDGFVPTENIRSIEKSSYKGSIKGSTYTAGGRLNIATAGNRPAMAIVFTVEEEKNQFLETVKANFEHITVRD